MSGAATQDGISYLLGLMSNGEQAVDNYHIALIQVLPPGFTIGGDELDEPDVDEYDRAVIINDSGNWEISENTLFNVVELTYPTALSSWGAINFWAVCDSSQGLGGRVLWVGQFDSPYFVETGDQVFIAAGGLNLPLSGSQWAFG